MTIPVDIWLRGTDFATTSSIDDIARAPQQWTDDDVRRLLEGMLREMDRRKRPGEEEREVVLRGLSWIVNAFEDGGVVVAIEIPTGAAVAGPVDVDQHTLETMIARVLATQSVSPSSSVH